MEIIYTKESKMLFKQIVNMISIWFLNEKTVIVKLNFYYQLIFIRVNLTTYPKKKRHLLLNLSISKRHYFTPHLLNFPLNLTVYHYHMKIQLHR
ncbi:hypothetical protein CICLE_v10002962mg [Citrus x clementina]|uniref:Uncharacterized protein n=1 Tax=Citrus clementina TaxID=85681 RepID=V4T836_CITCL|nr:hypothetical protein CICLE_v10002962mg [Citrus x clementina]